MDKPVVTNPTLLASALDTLAAPQKALESKWFYDTAGSELFEQITDLPEYYPTRTEIGILQAHAAQLSQIVPTGSALVELGSGASVKTRILLEACPQLSQYAPVDISGPFLQEIAAKLRQDFPTLSVLPVVADFMATLSLPEEIAARPLVVFFPGSTIGNLTPPQAEALLGRIRAMGEVRALIVGADLVKDIETLTAAYDDAAGVTAAFNRNLLYRLNREAGATFRPEQFVHEARWNGDAARIEMHLVSREAQEVQLGSESVAFAAGESIHTENSHKYTRHRLDTMARAGGWQISDMLTDGAEQFSVSVLTPA